MRIDAARLLAGIGILAALLGFAGEAAAQPRQGAPITYAGRSETTTTAALDTRLAGGASTSYGYDSAPQPRRGAVIDLRRAQTTTSPAVTPPPIQQVRAQQQPTAPAQQTPEWLERERVGPPYQANGRWYVPTPEPGYSENGTASWYGPTFHGQATASGEPFDQESISAAHPTLPIPSLVQVTNLENGREIIVRVNDRGPFVGDRVIDLSHRAAEVLGFSQSGTARVNVRYLGPAPRHVIANGATQAPPANVQPAPAYAPPPSAAPATVAQREDGPVSLLPASAPAQPASAPSDELVGAPLGPQPQATTQTVSYTPPAATGGYVVQVGAYSASDTAERVRAAVSAAGPVNVDTRSTAAGQLHRVRLGPFASREEAETARQHVAQIGYSEAILAAR